jgi:hypothetical protein
MAFTTPAYAITKSNPAAAYTNRVVDAKTNVGIPFVNIGVLHKGIGTVSDEAGYFSLDFTGAIITDTVKFSCIGYDDLIFTVEDLQHRTTAVPLRQKQTVLPSVVVKPQYLKKIELGVRSETDIVTGGFTSNDLGSELATVLQYNKKKPAFLKKVFISVAESSYDSLLFRVNVYSVKNGLPDKNILPVAVYIKSAIKNGVIEVDMDKYDISFTKPIAVSIEWLKDLGTGSLFFSSKFFKGQSFSRKTSQAAWEKIPVGVAIWADVNYEYK